MAEPVTDSDISDLRRALDDVFLRLGAEGARRALPPLRPVAADRAKVVVIGEVGSGKTSLINAFLGRPELLPVQPTSQYVAIGAGQPGQPETVRVHFSDGRVETGEPDALRRLLQSASGDEVTIDHAEVLLDEPRLANMTLFDTPGVLGLDTTTTELTLSALNQATALVFVCSVPAKVSIAEREFLAKAVHSIDHIVFVLSKVHETDDLGDANMEENKEALKKTALGDWVSSMAFVPFSAELAEEGARGDTQSLAESGLPELRDHLERIAANQIPFAQRNILRAMKEAISLAYSLLALRQTTSESPTDTDELDRVTAWLEELRQRSAEWRIKLGRDIGNASHDAQREHRRRVKELRDQYNVRLSGKNPRLDSFETDLAADLCGLQTDTDADVRARISAIARALLSDIAGSDTYIDDLVNDLPRPDQTPADYLLERRSPTKDPSETVAGIQGTYLGWMMAQNLAHTIAGAAVAGPAVLPLGFAWYYVQRRIRDKARRLAALNARTREHINDFEREMSSDISHALNDASWALQDAVDKAITAAIKAANDAKKRLEDDASERDREIGRIDRIAKELPKLTKKWRELHDRLQALTAAPVASPLEAKSRGMSEAAESLSPAP